MLLLAASLIACGGAPSDAPDARVVPDGGVAADASQLDASVADAAVLDGAAPRDGGSEADGAVASDAGFDPLLVIAGECGVLDTELSDALPHWVQSSSTFASGFMRSEAMRLSAGAQTILSEGTAGGSSGYSEAFAFEVLHRCEGAALVATETMIRYSVPMPGAITDILVEIGGERIGVSVTRAVTVTGMCMRADTFSAAAATDLLTRKLEGINESSMLVAPEDAWTKQILFVYADTEAHASELMSAWSTLDDALRADTILYVSVSESADAFIYFEDRCP